MSSMSRLTVVTGLALGLLGSGLLQPARADWPDLRLRSAEAQRELAPKLRLIPRSHPRIFIRSDKDLEAVRERIRSNPGVAQAYQYLLQWARSDQYYENLWATPLQLQAAVVAYRLEGRDSKIKRHALKIMDYLVKTDGDSWTWPRMAKGLAFAYDWMYDDLRPSERKKYGERAIYAAQQCYKTWRHSDFNNHLYLEYGPILYVGVALQGDGIDDHSARQLALDGLELLFKHYLPAHEYVNMGDGGWHESMSYSAFFTYEFAQLVELWSSASGEDLWRNFYGLEGEAHFQAYNLRPFDEHRVHVADLGGPDPVDWQILAYMPLVSRRYGDGLARYWSDWLMTGSQRKAREGNKYALDGYRFWPYVLWYDPEVPVVKPEELPLAHIFRGYGWVSMRSSWEKDASFALFVCSPTWYGGHQHCDNNSFIIHKYAPLALDTGVYDTAQGHRANYFARTIAHNTVTVSDPEEKFTGGNWGGSADQSVTNDGGQLYMAGPDVVAEVGPGTRFDRSELLAYETTPQYTYAVGDASQAYSPKKVSEFTRAFLYLRPDIFVVFDRVEATSPEFKKRWLLHSQNEPTVSGSKTSPTGGRTFTITNGPGKLWGQTLLPGKVTYETVGGPGREFWVDGKNWPPGKGVRDDTGRWRLEVSPGAAAYRDYFLHLLYATDSEDTDYPKAEVSQNEKEVTLTIGHQGTTYVVTFSKQGPLTGSLHITGPGGTVLSEGDLATTVVLDAQQTNP